MKALHADHQSWNRWILNAYWILILLILLFSLIAYMLSRSGTYMVLPSDLIKLEAPALFILIIAECLIRIMKRYFEHLLIIIGFLIALFIMLAYSKQEIGMYITLGIPMLLSYCYFDRALLKFATLFTAGGFVAAVLCVPALKGQIHFWDIIIIFAFMIGMSMLGFTIISRGEELQHALEKAILSELEAFADSVAVENDAKIDHLTGLYNHITYQEYARLLVEQHQQYGMRLTLAVIDIDNFKYVNDSFGHHVGDVVLMQTAAIVKHSITSEDIAARYGGEEFVVLMTGKSVPEAAAAMELVRARLEQTFFPELGEHRVTMSIGIAEYKQGMDTDELFRLADVNLYRAKRGGKNRIVAAMDEEVIPNA
ncbi:GGDEF domain-containing protein [Paenibacillus sp. PL2-23]|uniref:GGDEF domain-containing protein n=1 Tax=Paenibacillus sp. PL2-23 TaxID=2100729 RepID=UPI0030F7B06B